LAHFISLRFIFVSLLFSCDFLKFPNKTTSQIVEYYYDEWKRSEAYIELRQAKRDKKQANKLQEVALSCSQNNLEQQHPSLSEHPSQTRILCVSCQCSKLAENFSRSHRLKTMSNASETKDTKSMDSDEPVDTKTLDFRNDHTPIDPNNSKSSLSAKMCYQPIAQQQQQCAGENLCDECMLYWKKYAAYKYNYVYPESERPGPEQRQERLEASRSQLFTCVVDSCQRTFKKKSEYASHSVVSHALVLKKLVKPACPLFNELHNFCFRPTVMTRAIRCLADRRKRGTELKFSRKLARRPVKSQMGCNKSVIEKCKIFSNY